MTIPNSVKYIRSTKGFTNKCHRYTKNEKIKLILLLALLNKARFYNQSTESIHGSIVSEESENVRCISVDTEFFV